MYGLLFCAVHPRVRGEQAISSTINPVIDGSSPRARGAVAVRRFLALQGRFIPACAGSRPPGQYEQTTLAVHPRVRGEQCHDRMAEALLIGSSPRARGAGFELALVLAQLRFIPTCAGSRGALMSPYLSRAVHPHVRGEQIICQHHLNLCFGSSPRARGAAHNGIENLFNTRFIPTCAGSRYQSLGVTGPQTVHPHVRGEQRNQSPDGLQAAGSSPRARGAAEMVKTYGVQWRFIPACAGSSSRPLWLQHDVTVHPRVRGEQRSPLGDRSASLGSSPRARGAGAQGVAVAVHLRFIPACAGSSPLSRLGYGWLVVHPRVRGEQNLLISRHFNSAGSSPRARGAGGQ